MVKSFFKKMCGKYESQGDYLIPCLNVPGEEEQPVYIWGQQHLDYCDWTDKKEVIPLMDYLMN